MIISIVTPTLRQTFMVLPIQQRESVRLLSLVSPAQGECDCELGPAFMAVYRCRASSVNSDNCLNEGKSKSVPPRRASFDSSLEEVTTNLRIETRAVVFHSKRGHVIVCSKRDTDQA
jgi:hypothetical protein